MDEIAEADGRAAQVLEAAVDRFGRDDGHLRPAVRTATTALEGLLRLQQEPGISGENLAIVFSVWDPTPLGSVLDA